MHRNRSSRLKRTTERQNKRQALLFGIGTVIVIFLLVQFGPLLINIFGNAIYTLRGGDASTQNEITGRELLQAPSIFGITDATQSARISFSGLAPSNEGIIEIYLNDQLENEIKLQNETAFEVTIDLKRGKNYIKARYAFNNKTSPFSDEYTVNYTTDRPDLEINFPNENAVFTRADKSINVAGRTNPENTITVNSFRAIVDSSGSFTYLLQLNDGENTIQVEATNPAGVNTQKEVKVTYQP